MNETVQPGQPVTSSSYDNFFRKRYTSRIAFAVGILLFLLPFAEFKCGSVTMLGNTGIGIAAGSPWKIAGGFSQNEIMDKLKTSAKQGKDLMKDGPNIFALAALVAAGFGLAISFTAFSWRSLGAMCAGILSAVMLIALMIQFRIEMHSLTRKEVGEESLDIGGIMKIQFTAWYYLSLIAFVVAAFLNYMYDRLALRDAIDRSMDFEFQQKG